MPKASRASSPTPRMMPVPRTSGRPTRPRRCPAPGRPPTCRSTTWWPPPCRPAATPSTPATASSARTLSSPAPVPRRACGSLVRACSSSRPSATSWPAVPRRSPPAFPCSAATQGRTDLATASAFLAEHGALMVKAVAGGGGRGHARRHRAVASSRTQWRHVPARPSAAFGDGAVYVEELLVGARHIEVQVVGDGHARRAPLRPRLQPPAPPAEGRRVRAGVLDRRSGAHPSARRGGRAWASTPATTRSAPSSSW